MKIVAIITARGGSKGLPGKNIRPLNGIPMIAHSIMAAQNSTHIQDVFVTSDDPQILKIAKEFGAKTITRPPELATDTASSYDAVIHALNTIEQSYDAFVLLQPTSPLRNAQHINEAIEIFTQSNVSSCLSVCEAEHHPYKCFIAGSDNHDLLPIHDIQSLSAARQTLPTAYRQNGAIYINNIQDFKNSTYQSFVTQPMTTYIMDHTHSIDIDTMSDFNTAESYLAQE